MRIFCDENVPTAVAQRLDGVDALEVRTVETELGAGANDHEVREYAENHDCVVLTNDKGFLQTKHGDDHGLLYFHQHSKPNACDIATAVEKIADAYVDYDNVEEIVPDGWA